MRFQNHHANSIVSFLSRTDANEDVFVCCDSGQSRSAAIAAAVLLAIGETDQNIWNSTEYHPNLLVFRKMCVALGLDISEEEMLKRKGTNDAAIHEAIEKSGHKSNGL